MSHVIVSATEEIDCSLSLVNRIQHVEIPAKKIWFFGESTEETASKRTSSKLLECCYYLRFTLSSNLAYILTQWIQIIDWISNLSIQIDSRVLLKNKKKILYNKIMKKWVWYISIIISQSRCIKGYCKYIVGIGWENIIIIIMHNHKKSSFKRS